MVKNIKQNPTITDTIRFLIETPDSNNCLLSHPYKINSVKIYFLQKSYVSTNHGEYKNLKLDDKIFESLKLARQIACQNPTQKNISEVSRLQNELDSKSQSSSFYYNDAVLVEQIGDEENPAWFSVEPNNSLLNQIFDQNGNVVYGSFTYDWQPKSKVREGDFLICWTWTPNIAGESVSASEYFYLLSDGKNSQTIPTHVTAENKYYTLLERYLPEMYKSSLIDNDLTPEVTDKLNKAVGKGFTFIEDLSNQLIDLYDSNVLHESMLVYLSNLFNIKLKSNDPTLWRRQIKEAVPLFKKKGTIIGLKEAFLQSGMYLEKFTQLWQVISPYTWQQSFLVNDSPYFKLDKKPIDKIQLWIRREGENNYTEYNVDNIDFEEIDCNHYIVWVGDEKSLSPVNIYKNDNIKVLYQYRDIPNDQESVEEYIRSLPLADNRDDNNQYPLKNWNVRLIEEDDVMFDSIVPVRHPFHEDLIFGQIRTEFPYSENIYNMETYNGSLVDSYDPCYIDKNFRDPCGSCLSGKYNIDLTISELSNDRIREVYDILREFTPFTSVVNQVNFKGEISDYVNSGVEEIDFLIQYNLVEFVISGEVNPFFHRVMEGGLTNWIIKRDDLSQQIVKVSNKTGLAYNTNVSFISPNISLENLGLIKNNHIMEVLSPSANSGTYLLNNISGNTALNVESVSEPLSTEVFTFKLSNIVLESNINIIQESCSTLQDSSISFDNVNTLWDVENTPDYTGGSWKINFPILSKTVDISKNHDKMLYLSCDEIIPSGNYAYILLDDQDNEIHTSNCSINVLNRGRISFNDLNLISSEFIRHGDYLLYDGVEYMIDELRINNDIIANNYNDGEVNGLTVKFLRRLVENSIGYFTYQGLQLLCDFDHEAEFNIQNGLNHTVTENNLLNNNNFKENFLVKIDENYYKIEEIKGELITLNGMPQDWGTLNSGGTTVNYSINQFVDKTVNVQFTVFDQLDRSGQDPIIREIESTVTNDVAIVALSMNPNSGDGMEDFTNQDESISFQIDYKDGNKEEGNI